MLRVLLPLLCLAIAAVTLAAGAQPAAPAATSQPTALPAGRAAQKVAIIPVDSNSLDEVDQVSIIRRLDLAQGEGAGAIVLEISSRGGEIGAALDIAAHVRDSRVPVTAWIRGDTRGAAVLIALACSRIVFAPDATLGGPGDEPVSILRSKPAFGAASELDLLLPGITESARRNGWDEKLVQAFVAVGVQMWAVERAGPGGVERRLVDRAEYKLLFGLDPRPAPALLATEPAPTKVTFRPRGASRRGGSVLSGGGAAQVPEALRFRPATAAISKPVADSVSSVLSTPSARPVFTLADRDAWKVTQYITDGAGLVRIDAKQAATLGLSEATIRDETELRAFFGAGKVASAQPLWYETMAKVLSNPWVSGLLIAIFLIGLFLEYVMPASVVPGSVAAVALLLFITPRLLLGLSAWWPLAAIVAGVVIIALELFVLPSFGVLGIVGILSIFAGLIGTFVSGGAGSLFGAGGDATDLWNALIVVALSTLLAGGAMFVIARHLPGLPLFQRFVLSGAGEDAEVAPETEHPTDVLEVGLSGVAITPLRPSGRAEFGGQPHDVVCEDGFVAAGEAVRITQVSPFRVSVERA